MFSNWRILMMKPLGGYIDIYIYCYTSMYNFFYENDYIMDIIIILWWYYVVLRAPMVDLLQRSHMGRCYSHSTEAAWELSSGRVVGVSTCYRPCWTYPGQHQCGLNPFYSWAFNIYNLYVICFISNLNISMILKQKHWWSLTSSWPDEVQRMVFDRPDMFVYILILLYKSTDSFHE